MSLSNGPDEPLMSGNFTADHAAGQQAFAAAVVALFERERSGLGQHIDVALFDAAVSVLGFPFTAALNGVPVHRPGGNRDATAAPGNLFRSGDDRYLYIDAGTDGLFGALTEALDLAPDPRFATVSGRDAHVDELESLIAGSLSSLTAAEASRRLELAGVPHGIVQTLDEVIEDPLMAQRNLIAEFPDRRDGADMRVPGVPVKFGRTPGSVRRPPPEVSEHTDEILAELGYADGDIARLRAEGAV
jgi:crotonobetainyl-CoA:carnitine CoA-transferase CaiB-like acyl-CoA transferase